MNKSQLAEAVAREARLSKIDAVKALNAFVKVAVEALRAALPDSAFGAEAPLGLILGTGLSGLAAALAGDAGGAGPCVAPFAQLPGFPLPGGYDGDYHQQ